MKFTFRISVLLIFIFSLSSYSAFAQGSFGDLKGNGFRFYRRSRCRSFGRSKKIRQQMKRGLRRPVLRENFSSANLMSAVILLTWTSTGFAASTVKDVKVSVAFVTDQNITLSPSGSQATVTVTSGDVTTQVNTTDQQLSTLINNQKILDLPLLSRDPSSLVLLAPGNGSDGQRIGRFFRQRLA